MAEVALTCDSCGRTIKRDHYIRGKDRRVTNGKRRPRYCWPGEGCQKTGARQTRFQIERRKNGHTDTGKETPMAKKKETTNGSELGAELRAAVAAIAGAELLDKGSYYIVKRGGKTLGYVNGKVRTFRVDTAGPVADRQKLAVTEPSQIPAAVEILDSARPETKEVTPDPK